MLGLDWMCLILYIISICIIFVLYKTKTKKVWHLTDRIRRNPDENASLYGEELIPVFCDPLQFLLLLTGERGAD